MLSYLEKTTLSKSHKTLNPNVEVFIKKQIRAELKLNAQVSCYVASLRSWKRRVELYIKISTYNSQWIVIYVMPIVIYKTIGDFIIPRHINFIVNWQKRRNKVWHHENVQQLKQQASHTALASIELVLQIIICLADSDIHSPVSDQQNHVEKNMKFHTKWEVWIILIIILYALECEWENRERESSLYTWESLRGERG